jgi:response regulator RpfG family c-di-GMP phosphodiesterase
MMGRHRILIVDDDEKLLKSFQRVLGPRFEVQTARGGQAALDMIEIQEPFSLVISDYRMPEMDGVTFLSRARKSAPDTVRIMLTGHADLDVALKAVNEGNIFRMLTKPCQPAVMSLALKDALRMYELVSLEKDVMEKTVQSAVGLLGDIVSLVQPEVYGRISRIMPYARRICRDISPEDMWEIVTSIRLSMIGFITLPEGLVQKDLNGEKLTISQQETYSRHAKFAAKFVYKIPRMEAVARTIAYQEKRFDGGGFPKDDVAGLDLPLGARILKVVLDFDRHVCAGLGFGAALNAMSENGDWYDGDVIASLFGFLGTENAHRESRVHLNGLQAGMVTAQDVVASKGDKRIKLVADGSELSEMTIEYIQSFQDKYRVTDPILVREAKFCTL